MTQVYIFFPLLAEKRTLGFILDEDLGCRYLEGTMTGRCSVYYTDCESSVSHTEVSWRTPFYLQQHSFYSCFK